MRIGEIARLSGLSAHTLRYYERIGLRPMRAATGPGSGDYDASILAWIEFLGRPEDDRHADPRNAALRAPARTRTGDGD